MEEVRQAKLRSMLAGVVQYRIPLFQRTYDWGESQWARLWDDILAIYEADEPRTHFVGSVVTQRMPGAAGGATKFSVIDGQQRMTTLMILLCAIRDRAQRESDRWGNLPDAIQKQYLINEFADVPDERDKLAPTIRDAAPFRAMIDGDMPGETRIGAARRYFSRALNASDANGAPLDLRNLVNCIAARLDMVSITLDRNDNPNRIFESLNNTGLTLDAADLIRNYLFMNIRDPRKQDAAYEKHWFPMQEKLHWRQPHFFWRYLMMDGSLVKWEREVIFDGVRNLIGPDAGDDAIINALKEFHEFSAYYLEAVWPREHRTNRAISERITRLHQWGVDAANTFLMKAISHVHRGHIGANKLETVIEMIESFIVRRHVTGFTQSGLRNIFARMLREADFNEKSFVESSLNVLRNYRWANDHDFIQGFSRRELYVPNARYPRAWLILSRLERSFGSKETPDLNGEKVSIEHIMPQALTNEWRDALGPNSVEIHARLLHTLGNITFTGYNSEMSNKPFREKKPFLAESSFALNSSLKNLDEWNAETIEQRGRELAERAAAIWRRPNPPVTTEN